MELLLPVAAAFSPVHLCYFRRCPKAAVLGTCKIIGDFGVFICTVFGASCSERNNSLNV